jgi:hypothetical protein
MTLAQASSDHAKPQTRTNKVRVYLDVYLVLLRLPFPDHLAWPLADSYTPKPQSCYSLGLFTRVFYRPIPDFSG